MISNSHSRKGGATLFFTTLTRVFVPTGDRKSTRLNSSHRCISYAVFCLKKKHPDAQIATEHISITDSAAIFRAVVSIPNGGSATGYGSQTAADLGDFIEKAETKAIRRAL